MMPNIRRGGGMRGMVAYLAGPGRSNEHTEARVVGGDRETMDAYAGPLGRERVSALARDLTEPQRLAGIDVLHGGKPGHVWHCSLSLTERDGVLSDEQWQRIAGGFVERMGFADEQNPCRWAAVRHGLSKATEQHGPLDHCHVVVELVREDGTAADVRFDRPRAQEACNRLEHEHGLEVLESRELGIGARASTPGERAIAEKVGLATEGVKRTETQRQYYARAARGCREESRNPEEFQARMAAGGLRVEYVTHNGRPGWKVTGPDGIAYAGGKLAKDLSYPRLIEHWRQNGAMDTADRAARVSAGRLAARSLRVEPEGHPGPLARESREVGRYAQTRASAPALTLPASLAQALRQRIKQAEQEAEHQRELEARLPARARTADRDRGIGI